jgi:trk system potassium uptake protein TrkH
MTGVMFLVCIAVLALFTCLLLPVSLAGGFDTPGFHASSMAIYAALGLFIAVLVLAAIQGRQRGLTRVQSLVALVIVWFLLPIAGALPFVVTGVAPLHIALFESFSGLTTTGATVYQDPNVLPLPLRFWRSELEWLGGFLTLVSILHILAPAGVGGLPRAGGRFVRGERELTAHLDFSRLRILLAQYSFVTIVITLGFVVCGVKAIDALMLAMTAIATGGFVPVHGSLDLELGHAGMLVMSIALALGATSLFWQTFSLKGLREAILQNRESVWIIRVIGVLAAGYAVLLFRGSGSTSVSGMFAALNEGLFTAASVVSTAGIETRPGVIALMPSLFVVFIILCGASIFSTAGGIKFYRLAGMLAHSWRELELLIFPSAVRAVHFFGERDSERAGRSVWAVFVLATVTICIACILLTVSGPGFEAGFVAVLALFANAGHIYTALIPLGADPEVWPKFADFGLMGMAVAIVVMVLGRLEVVVVFAALNIAYWTNR